MWPTGVSWQDVLEFVRLLGAVLGVVGGALTIVQGIRGGRGKRHDGEDPS